MAVNSCSKVIQCDVRNKPNMNNIVYCLCIHFIFLCCSNAVPVKLVPGDRTVIKKDGATHTISKYYVVPKDLDVNAIKTKPKYLRIRGENRDDTDSSETGTIEDDGNYYHDEVKVPNDSSQAEEDGTKNSNDKNSNTISVLGLQNSNHSARVKVKPIYSNNTNKTSETNEKRSPIVYPQNIDDEIGDIEDYIFEAFSASVDAIAAQNIHDFWELVKMYVSAKSQEHELPLKVEKLAQLLSIFTKLYEAVQNGDEIESKIDRTVNILREQGNNTTENPTYEHSLRQDDEDYNNSEKQNDQLEIELMLKCQQLVKTNPDLRNMLLKSTGADDDIKLNIHNEDSPTSYFSTNNVSPWIKMHPTVLSFSSDEKTNIEASEPPTQETSPWGGHNIIYSTKNNKSAGFGTDQIEGLLAPNPNPSSYPRFQLEDIFPERLPLRDDESVDAVKGQIDNKPTSMSWNKDKNELLSDNKFPGKLPLNEEDGYELLSEVDKISVTTQKYFTPLYQDLEKRFTETLPLKEDGSANALTSQIDKKPIVVAWNKHIEEPLLNDEISGRLPLNGENRSAHESISEIHEKSTNISGNNNTEQPLLNRFGETLPLNGNDSSVYQSTSKIDEKLTTTPWNEYNEEPLWNIGDQTVEKPIDDSNEKQESSVENSEQDLISRPLDEKLTNKPLWSLGENGNPIVNDNTTPIKYGNRWQVVNQNEDSDETIHKLPVISESPTNDPYLNSILTKFNITNSSANLYSHNYAKNPASLVYQHPGIKHIVKLKTKYNPSTDPNKTSLIFSNHQTPSYVNVVKEPSQNLQQAEINLPYEAKIGFEKSINSLTNKPQNIDLNAYDNIENVNLYKQENKKPNLEVSTYEQGPIHKIIPLPKKGIEGNIMDNIRPTVLDKSTAPGAVIYSIHSSSHHLPVYSNKVKHKITTIIEPYTGVEASHNVQKYIDVTYGKDNTIRPIINLSKSENRVSNGYEQFSDPDSHSTEIIGENGGPLIYDINTDPHDSQIYSELVNHKKAEIINLNTDVRPNQFPSNNQKFIDLTYEKERPIINLSKPQNQEPNRYEYESDPVSHSTETSVENGRPTFYDINLNTPNSKVRSDEVNNEITKIIKPNTDVTPNVFQNNDQKDVDLTYEKGNNAKQVINVPESDSESPDYNTVDYGDLELNADNGGPKTENTNVNAKIRISNIPSILHEFQILPNIVKEKIIKPIDTKTYYKKILIDMKPNYFPDEYNVEDSRQTNEGDLYINNPPHKTSDFKQLNTIYVTDKDANGIHKIYKIVQQPYVREIHVTKPTNFITYLQKKKPVRNLAATYQLFSLNNLLEVRNALIKAKQNPLSSYSDKVLTNFIKIIDLFLTLADNYNNENRWYENVFDPANLTRHPLQLYIYNLLRQRWLHELLHILRNNNNNLNVLKYPAVISILDSWRFPDTVQHYLRVQPNIVDISGKKTDNNNVPNTETPAIIKDYIAKKVVNINRPATQSLILKITGLKSEQDANEIVDIVKKYIYYKTYVLNQEKLINQDSKIVMLKQIILYLRDKGYSADIITDLIHKLYGEVVKINRCQSHSNDFAKNMLNVIAPVLNSGR